MNILQICNKPPLPAIDGGCKAMNQTTQMLLSKHNSVKVFAISTHKHPIIKLAVNNLYIKQVNFETQFLNTKVSTVSAFINLFSSVPYNVARFFDFGISAQLLKIVTTEKFDAIIFESIYMAEYYDVLKKHCNAIFFLRSHNIEHLLWQKRTEAEVNWAKKIYSKLLTAKLKKYELLQFEKFKNIICITTDDQNYIEQHAHNTNATTIAFAAETKTNDFIQKEFPTFYHLGAMDWQPNIDAVNWVIANIINGKLNTKNFKFYIAGKGMPLLFFALQTPSFVVEGEVENAADFIALHDVLIAPIFSGGGMRIKIVEAMQMGKVVITTQLGAAGIPHLYNNMPCILMAENATEFINHINNCIDNYTYRKTIAANAKLAIEQEFGYEALSNKLSHFLNLAVNDQHAQ